MSSGSGAASDGEGLEEGAPDSEYEDEADASQMPALQKRDNSQVL